MKTTRKNSYIEAKIEAGEKYKVNRCTKSDKVYIYMWNVEKNKWDIKMALIGEFSIVLE
ncbi:hypothetical protein KAR91_22320 [Candidatus Pacearchaeota archaeon]|nr:hypothetical protein [Candidatus Pacearchaeota archaeon]